MNKKSKKVEQQISDLMQNIIDKYLNGEWKGYVFAEYNEDSEEWNLEIRFQTDDTPISYTITIDYGHIYQGYHFECVNVYFSPKLEKTGNCLQDEFDLLCRLGDLIVDYCEKEMREISLKEVTYINYFRANLHFTVTDGLLQWGNCNINADFKYTKCKPGSISQFSQLSPARKRIKQASDSASKNLFKGSIE